MNQYNIEQTQKKKEAEKRKVIYALPELNS
jgi:hypothetical protein